MSAGAEKKIQEAQDHIKNAEKYLKTSLTKWKADYDLAADAYNRAASCYKGAKSYQESKDCLMKAADCYKKYNSLYNAAKCLQEATLICKELGQLNEIGPLAERATLMYQQHGATDAGALCLEKSAKMIETQYPERAVELYKRGVELVLIEDRPRSAAEFCSKFSRLLVRLGKYDEATDAIRREISINQQTENIGAIGRLVVALVLVQLAREDYVAAEKAFKEWGNYCECEEITAMELLLRAYDEEDAGEARKALHSPFIRHMDVEYAKLARDLKLPQGLAAPTSEVRENAADSYRSVSGSAQSEDGGDVQGGLC